MARGNPHGTIVDPKRVHPALDLKFWEQMCPLPEKRSSGGIGYVDSPKQLAHAEQARDLAAGFGELGQSVPADLFVWSSASELTQSVTTKIGGVPWRSAKKRWPTDKRKVPLHFLAQINFSDSKDLLPFDLPGDIALIFGRWDKGSVGIDPRRFVLEWSSLDLDDPITFHDVSPFGGLSFCHEGVIHRTRQHIDRESNDGPFELAGWKNGGWNIASLQATSIGTYSNLPQGWPFESGDGNTLVCTLSSYSFYGRWPLCDMPGTVTLNRDGSERRIPSTSAWDLLFGDVGALWVYRDAKGKFKLGCTC